MRVSEYYKLGLEQPSLDFVDVKLETDVPVFIDPTALHLLYTEWGAECRSLIQDYFNLVLDKIRHDKHSEAQMLLGNLSEPNETHLGLSVRRSRGHGMGSKLAEKIWHELKESRAIETGLISDLEDTALMINGIASDVISDIVTNIIRQPLLKYTEDMCEYYGIPMDNIASKPIWNPNDKQWSTEQYVNQPVVNGAPLMLVPKAIVRRSITYDAGRYYNLYLLEALKGEPVAQGLVRILKNGERIPPTKKALRERFGSGKSANRYLTPMIKRENILERYRNEQRNTPKAALDHASLVETLDTPEPDWDELLEGLLKITPGKESAKAFEKAVKALLDALFYPWLMYPEAQTPILSGSKIVDITYANVAQDNFFKWVKDNYPAAHILIECKNYSTDPKNPELDQLAGRFSKSRGQVGLLIARQITNRPLMTNRCRYTADDKRGYIIALDDNDMRSLVEAKKSEPNDKQLELLWKRFRELVL